MNTLAINGSPRRNGNTATLLESALSGAASRGSTTQMIHLYDYNYKGCMSCFECKLKNGISYGKCGINDEITPIFECLKQSDNIIFGSPIYFRSITGEMKSFLERFLYPHLVYDKNSSSLFNRKVNVGFIYTMNINEEQMKLLNYQLTFRNIEYYMKRIFGTYNELIAYDTFQFDDYSKYNAEIFNENTKKIRKQEQFPIDCQNAFSLGENFINIQNG